MPGKAFASIQARDNEKATRPAESSPSILEGLLEGITDKNLHPEMETGPEVGEEADATQDQSG
jgi:hypothetical protein